MQAEVHASGLVFVEHTVTPNCAMLMCLLYVAHNREQSGAITAGSSERPSARTWCERRGQGFTPEAQRGSRYVFVQPG